MDDREVGDAVGAGQFPAGLEVRPRVDLFLNYWLTMRTLSDVPSHQVFPAFRAYVEGLSLPITDVAADVAAVGKQYRALDSVAGPSPLETFLYRWRTMEAGVSTPLLLWLFSQEIDELDRQACLDSLESYLVRRMACRMTTKDYNRLFLDLLEHLESRPLGQTATAALSGLLAEQASESRLWPTDLQFTAAIIDLPLYRLLTRGRLRLILEAIEDHLRSDFAEEASCPRGLTIEHVMPQSWDEHWPIADDTDVGQAAIDRSRLIHSLGNLTLVNKKLNPSLSNSPWATKAVGFADHTTLYLNKRLLKDWAEHDFSDSAIKLRGATLAEAACGIWPRGDT